MGKFVFTDEETKIPYLVSKKDNEWGVEKAYPFNYFNYIKDYTYEAEYDELDCDLALSAFQEKRVVPPNNNALQAKPKYEKFKGGNLWGGACSAIRNGNFYGRNFDWVYGEDTECVIHITAKPGRHASLNVGGQIAELTNEFIKSKDPSDSYKLLPFMVVDGINDAGVVCNINVVPCDKGFTVGTIPTEEQEYELCNMMLCRFILDKFDNAKDAVEYVQKHVSVFMPDTLYNMSYDLHLLCADPNETYLIEWINNETVVTNMTSGSNSILAGKSYMTNCFLSDIVLNADGTVYTPGTQDATHNAVDTNNITEHGDGLERYNLIVSMFDNANTKEGMRNLMNALTYTNSYKTSTNPLWCTEFVGTNGLTVKSPISEYLSLIKHYENEVLPNMTRDKNSPYYGLWQTSHSSVYDIENKKLYIICQEDGKELEFTL